MIEKVQSVFLRDLPIAFPTGGLAAAPAPEIPSIITAGAVAHPTVIDLVRQRLRIMGKGHRAGDSRKPAGPYHHHSLRTVIQVFNNIMTGPAFVTDLCHEMSDHL